MGTYYKPQSPIQSGEDFIYPITTADQIMKSDKSRRLEQAGLIVADNSANLGGQGPGYYATAQDVSQLRAMVGPFMFRYDAEDGHLYMDYDNGYEADKWSVSADGHLLYTF